jgi:hypothetical protein
MQASGQPGEVPQMRRKTLVEITRWSVDPDGTTLHARFDDTHGRIQEQAGHKVP